MDTTLLQRPPLEKIATSVAGLSIAICLLLTQNTIFSAQSIGAITGLSPSINKIKIIEQQKSINFDQETNRKYGSSNIVDIEKGIKHVRMIKFYNNKPVRINIVEISLGLNQSLRIQPSIASETLASRKKITNIASQNNAIVAINGGYFKPQTGVPLGTLMINKKVYTGPIYDRVAMGIFEDGFDMARVQLKANVKTNKGDLKIDNINQPRMLSTNAIVYTSDWGEVTPATPKYGKQIVVSDGKLLAVNRISNKIPKDGFVIVGPQKKLDTILTASKFKLDVKICPEWKGVNHIISGGPYLVKNDDIYVDMTAEKLASIGGRNPRTAIGFTKDNNLIMLTADGREGASIGLTLVELANLMKEFGCVNAMNLDGGGSTVMYVRGKVVNKPQVQGGIPLSHTLLVKQVS